MDWQLENMKQCDVAKDHGPSVRALVIDLRVIISIRFKGSRVLIRVVTVTHCVFSKDKDDPEQIAQTAQHSQIVVRHSNKPQRKQWPTSLVWWHFI